MPDGSHELFALGARGVNKTMAATHIQENELANAQNAETPLVSAMGALDQRPGMTRVTAAAIDSASVLGIHDVPASLQSDLTPHLYVSMATGSFCFRTSTDGITWTNVPTATIPVFAMNGFLDLHFTKSWSKLITIGNKMYWIAQPNLSGTNPLNLWVFDGTTATQLISVPPGVVGANLSTPNAPLVIANSGATTYTYVVVAKFGSSHSAASATGSTTTGLPFAQLSCSGGNYIAVEPTTPPIQGATSYDVYRTVGGSTQGLVGTIPIVNGAFTSGNGSGCSTNPAIPFTDAGLTGDGTTAPNTASGTVAVNPVAIGDMITDSQQLYLAAIDVVATGGRIVNFDPVSLMFGLALSGSWPTSSGNGTPGALVNYDGSITYGTYDGTGAGNTVYVTTAGYPLTFGGATDVHTFAASYFPTQMVVFNGGLYVATCWLGANGTAAAIYQRLTKAAWTSVNTGPATKSGNAWTTLGVFNGRLYAGWTSGDGSSAAIIQSTPDGITWTTEYTANTTDVPGQMVVFNGSLFVVMAKTPASYNTTSYVLKRTAGGAWSIVDNVGSNYVGGIGIAYF